MEDGLGGFEAAAAARLRGRGPDGGAREMAAVVEDGAPALPPEAETLDLIVGADPRYGGARTIVDSRGFKDEMGRPDRAVEPYPRPGGYEALVTERPGPGGLDYWLAEFSGRLYMRKTFIDDTSPSEYRPAAGEALDPFFAAMDTARCVGASLALARALGFPADATRVLVGFRWTGLRGREINTWANQHLDVSPNRVAETDRTESLISVPLATSDGDLAPFVATALRPLFGVFGWAPDARALEREIEGALGPTPG